MDPMTEARNMIDLRVSQHPQSPFYQYAHSEMADIETFVSGGMKPDKVFYERLTHGVGLMCARELEPSDPAFCDAIYKMIEHVRLQLA